MVDRLVVDPPEHCFRA